MRFMFFFRFCRSSFHVSSLVLTVRLFFVDSTDSHPGLSNREEKKWFSYFDCSNTLQQQRSFIIFRLRNAFRRHGRNAITMNSMQTTVLRQYMRMIESVFFSPSHRRLLMRNEMGLALFEWKFTLNAKIPDNLAVATHTCTHTNKHTSIQRKAYMVFSRWIAYTESTHAHSNTNTNGGFIAFYYWRADTYLTFSFHNNTSFPSPLLMLLLLLPFDGVGRW